LTVTVDRNPPLEKTEEALVSIALDPITRRKLVLVCQFYGRAIQLADSPSPVDHIMAVIVFDLAAETALKAACTALDPRHVPKNDFQPLSQQVDSLLLGVGLGSLPRMATLQQVHNLRNNAQHRATYPHPSEVQDCRTYTRDFLDDLVQQVWGIAFADISLADTVRHMETRQLLKDAELALDQGDLPPVLENAVRATSRALASVARAVVGPDVGKPMYSWGLGGQVGPTMHQQSDKAMARMQEMLLYVALGLDYGAAKRIERVTGVLTNGDLVGMNQPLTRLDAERVLAHAIDTVVQIEERVGDLDAPFSI
jgi:hypothetical protein